MIFFFFFFFCSASLSLVGNSGHLNWVIKTAAARAALPFFISVCSVLTYPYNGTRLPVFGIFNMRTDVDACDCTRGEYGHRKRICIKS